ncbi:MAG: class II fructose-bisphosphate aldolase [Firmicutes bacterium]|nr:class II fructose-bisphosphate aldolase [Bacillota bacterium]
MALVTLQEILPKRAGDYAVGAFNVHNMEYTQGVISAAEAEKAPVILMIGAPMIKYFGLGWMAAIGRYAAESASIPVALHLDHSRDFELIKQAIGCGFSSVMIDGSGLSFTKNIELTKRVVDFASKAGVSVEGELGAIGGKEDNIETLAGKLTDPEEAREFVLATGVDALAVAIGNCHGLYTGKPNLDLERLASIKEATTCPLVLHGGSDLPDIQVQEAIKHGIRKVNVGTELKIAFRHGVEKALATSDAFEVPAVLEPARKAVSELVRTKIRLLGSSGRFG